MVFVDTHHLIPMFERRVSQPRVCDLAIDAADNRLAIAGCDGTIEITASQPERPLHPAPQATDDSANWDMRVLVPPDDGWLFIEHENMVVDPKGRFWPLVTKSLPQHDRNEGFLFFVRDEEQRTISEKIATKPEASILNERISADATTLAFRPNGEPIVLFRRRTGRDSYDGHILLGTREVAGGWSFRPPIVEHGNEGQWPTLVISPKGEPSEAFYFRYSFFGLIRAARSSKPAAPWPTAQIGEWGDGLRLQSRRTSGGDYTSCSSPTATKATTRRRCTLFGMAGSIAERRWTPPQSQYAIWNFSLTTRRWSWRIAVCMEK